MTEENDIYKKLKLLRRSRGLSVNALAEKLGEDHQKVGRIERGRRSLTIDYLMKVSRALETPIESLLDQKSSENPHPQLLGDIVVAVESSLSAISEPKVKGMLISKIFEEAKKFPSHIQQQVTDSIISVVSIVLK